MEEYVTRSVLETQKIAKKIVSRILNDKKRKIAAVLALSGDFGAGKTRFAQATAKALGIKETIPSPTFVLERVYSIKKFPHKKFIHIDAYRIESVRDLKQIGWNEIKKDPKNLILVEWANKIERALPKDAIKIKLEHVNENIRKIRIMN